LSLYNTAQNYNGLRQNTWSNIKQAITARNTTLNMQTKASIISFIAKYSDSNGQFNVQQVIDTIASRSNSEGLNATFNDLSTLIILVNSQLLNNLNNVPVTSFDVVNIINKMNISASSTEQLSQLASLAANYAAGNNPSDC
jgi:hypothetical protein